MKRVYVMLLFNLHPDFLFEKSGSVSNTKKFSGSANPHFLWVSTLKKVGFINPKPRWPPWKNLGSENLDYFRVSTLKNLRCHPQNIFSGCRLKGWLPKRPVLPNKGKSIRFVWVFIALGMSNFVPRGPFKGLRLNVHVVHMVPLICVSCLVHQVKALAKLYIPSTLNTDYLLWHTQLIVCAVKY